MRPCCKLERSSVNVKACSRTSGRGCDADRRPGRAIRGRRLRDGRRRASARDACRTPRGHGRGGGQRRRDHRAHPRARPRSLAYAGGAACAADQAAPPGASLLPGPRRRSAHHGGPRAADRRRHPPTGRRKDQHEGRRVRFARRVASGLGVLSAYQPGRACGRHPPRRHGCRQRTAPGATGFAQGAGLRPPQLRGVLRRDRHRQMRTRCLESTGTAWARGATSPSTMSGWSTVPP